MQVILDGQDVILREAEIIDHHLHNKEHWYGAGAVEDSLTGYNIISGNGIFGTEVEIFSSAFAMAGMLSYDFHRIIPLTISSATVYMIRIIWGLGTVADAESAGQYTTFPIISSGVGANIDGLPEDIINKRINFGNTVWMKCKNNTDSATITLLAGIHPYKYYGD